MKKLTCLITILLCLLISIPSYSSWNNPYPARDATKNFFYTSFTERPKTLDPAKAYSADELVLIAQIYEPPLQYHYLLRPYHLTPLTATEMPTVDYYDASDHKLAVDAPSKQVAYTRYTISITPGIFYQPHPAFALNPAHQPTYWPLPKHYLSHHRITGVGDFSEQSTRELLADDYIYQIKRLASPDINSPIFGLMKYRIVGMSDYADALKKATQTQDPGAFVDLRSYDMKGVKRIDAYHYQIDVQGKDPQFIYWLAMPFFAPMPWEVERFYAQPGMARYNLNLSWYPVGTGPYLLTINNPNAEMRLERNTNYHGEHYPDTGMPEDKALGLLDRAGQPLPFIDKIIFTLEKESIPRWTKFLQGYYDNSTISSDSFDQAIRIDKYNDAALSPALQERGIRLRTTVSPSITYMGFNMQDPVVGGNSERARKLRQAISVAVDYDEYISIFANGRGLVAQGPIPPGIFGYIDGQAGVNPVVYEWKNNRAVLKPITVAKQLMREAGYPDGRDYVTGKPLMLNYDIPASAGPDDKAQFDWLRKQFQKIDIELNVRATQYNRFQEKMRTGQTQIYMWAWSADYPDPENFFFLFYGKNGKVKFGGENASNYQNVEFDALYDQLIELANTPERMAIIQKMITILQNDAPWLFGLFPKTYVLSQEWVMPGKINEIANNTLKYAKLDPQLRAIRRVEWNKPVLWPLALLFFGFIFCVAPVAYRYYQHERLPKRPIDE